MTIDLIAIRAEFEWDLFQLKAEVKRYTASTKERPVTPAWEVTVTPTADGDPDIEQSYRISQASLDFYGAEFARSIFADAIRSFVDARALARARNMDRNS
jgi:hypothetical protein